uniref:Pancreatic polypeptide n=1 Tax=Pelusios castaneus TaxID=367368 RepID=A0A8C8SK56_9SAUR
MVAARRRWASLFSLTCCLALLLGHLASTAPTHPKYPGDNAPVEELAQFYNELQQYLNMITRPRYGKRSSSRTLGEDPYNAPGWFDLRNGMCVSCQVTGRPGANAGGSAGGTLPNSALPWHGVSRSCVLWCG